MKEELALQNLIQGVRIAQSKGVFTLEEASALLISIQVAEARIEALQKEIPKKETKEE